MGPPSPRVRLENARRPDLAAVEAPALADTGALDLCIPEHVALQLALDEFDRRDVMLADGSRRRRTWTSHGLEFAPRLSGRNCR